jgi:hypothetical protein
MILREAVVSNIIKYLFLLISYNNEICINENLINKIRKDENIIINLINENYILYIIIFLLIILIIFIYIYKYIVLLKDKNIINYSYNENNKLIENNELLEDYLYNENNKLIKNNQATDHKLFIVV